MKKDIAKKRLNDARIKKLHIDITLSNGQLLENVQINFLEADFEIIASSTSGSIRCYYFNAEDVVCITILKDRGILHE